MQGDQKFAPKRGGGGGAPKSKSEFCCFLYIGSLKIAGDNECCWLV